jgi:hypothetical protein
MHRAIASLGGAMKLSTVQIHGHRLALARWVASPAVHGDAIPSEAALFNGWCRTSSTAARVRRI